MKKLTPTVAIIFVLAAQPGSAQSDSYSQLVAKAQADLNAGNASQALAESQQAIKVAPTRWEAYVAAGGAFQLEHLYDKATEQYSQALDRAPAAKKAAVRALLQKVVVAASTPASPPTGDSTPPSADGPSYADTVSYITTNVAKAGTPRANETYYDHGSTTQKQARYSFSINSCTSFTVTWEYRENDGAFIGDSGQSFPASSTEMTSVVTFDMNHVGFHFQDTGPSRGDVNIISMDGSGHYSFHSGGTDPSNTPLNVEGDLTYRGDPKISGYNLGRFAEGGNVALGTAIPFLMPGTEDIGPHLLNAFQHLQQICKEHPEQAPKQPF